MQWAGYIRSSKTFYSSTKNNAIQFELIQAAGQSLLRWKQFCVHEQDSIYSTLDTSNTVTYSSPIKKIWLIFFLKINALFPKKFWKMLKNALPHNVSWIHPCIWIRAKNLIGVHSGARLIFHPNFMEIRWIIFVWYWWQTNQPTNKWTQVK